MGIHQILWQQHVLQMRARVAQIYCMLPPNAMETRAIPATLNVSVGTQSAATIYAQPMEHLWEGGVYKTFVSTELQSRNLQQPAPIKNSGQNVTIHVSRALLFKATTYAGLTRATLVALVFLEIVLLEIVCRSRRRRAPESLAKRATIRAMLVLFRTEFTSAIKRVSF
jgi:hypothetical protein